MICGVCGGEFPPRGNKKYCSPECAKKKQQDQLDALAQRRRAESAVRLSPRPCQICGYLYWPLHGGNIYCSKDCSNEGQKRAIQRQNERRLAKKVAKSSLEKRE